MKNKYTLYKHIFPNNKIYIGMTSNDINIRWNNGHGYKNQPLIYRAIQKYGWGNIKHEIIKQDIPEYDIDELERFYIKLYKSNKPKYGYNIEDGGNKYKHLSIETRKKISNCQKGRIPPNKGISMSNEQKIKISNSHKGLLSGNKHPMYGKHHKEESLLKMSKSSKGIKCKDYVKKKFGKPVMCIETGIEYYAAIEAERKTGIYNSSISKCCNNKIKTAGGYHWQYILENKEENI